MWSARNGVRSLQVMKSKLLIERSGCDVCWLAAHKEINQKILDELPPAVCNRIKKNLPRDLTKVGQKELLDQFLNANASII